MLICFVKRGDETDSSQSKCPQICWSKTSHKASSNEDHGLDESMILTSEESSTLPNKYLGALTYNLLATIEYILNTGVSICQSLFHRLQVVIDRVELRHVSLIDHLLDAGMSEIITTDLLEAGS